MPTDNSWVDPEKLLTHKGISIYRTYRNDDVSQGRNQCHFTMDVMCETMACNCNTDRCLKVFDVRESVCWKTLDANQRAFPNEDEIADVLRKSIDLGEISADGFRSMVPPRPPKVAP